jgi:hypothetical protein
MLRRFWWIPLLSALIVGGVGAYAYRTVADAMREGMGEQLLASLNANVKALELWIAQQKTVARAAALHPDVRRGTSELVALYHATPREQRRQALLASGALQDVREDLKVITQENGYANFAVVQEDGLVLVAAQEASVGRRIPVDFGRFQRLFEGEEKLSTPALDDVLGGEPTPFLRLAAPVRDANGDIAAVVAFLLPADQFTQVLRITRAGESGESYAFDEHGVILSQSRFDEQLVEIGLLQQGQSSILNLEVRDPGGNMAQGFAPTTPPRGRPLTRMAAAAMSGEGGLDIDGYPDYRGVSVVGAWTWLPELGIGVTSEQDHAEAYAGLSTVRLAFTLLAGLLLMTSAGMLAYSIVLARTERSVRQFGRYRVIEKIGEGGMGKVFRAQHALLRRPTAVKLLDAEAASEEAVERFEREVQAAASLTHPNTIEIYDYGHTPEGDFYYAMEYLDGITLGQLVEWDGAQPEARVLHLLRQTTGSLAEAHGRGLIHRDLKPSNIMLCSRGEIFDYVKVLDFGLVRARDSDLQLTSTQSLTGTPLFMSPEALESPDKVDIHSDVYQLGTVAYHLLTGRHVVSGETLVEVMSSLLHQAPPAPSTLLGHAVSADLEQIILSCLEKDPARRPADARVLLRALESCVVEDRWTQDDAREWWNDTETKRESAHAAEGRTNSSLPSGWQLDAADRTGRA